MSAPELERLETSCSSPDAFTHEKISSSFQHKLRIVASALHSPSTRPRERVEGSDKLSPSQSAIYSIIKQ